MFDEANAKQRVAARSPTILNHVRHHARHSNEALFASLLTVTFFTGIFAAVYASLDRAHFKFTGDALDPLLFSVMMTSGVTFGDFEPTTALAKCILMVHLILSCVGAALIVSALVATIPPRFRPTNLVVGGDERPAARLAGRRPRGLN